ncbi:hypothetical protein AB205_0005590 [Aquarana catesbeiana]|uniref:Uncharacterized protein n=1 Tax=Aquarana catesbeiana TaxID=8400 RepID=A0A2G9PXB5_AQUCT|nr:hypothetical protein AB205_0005590 [Aquarana catesbeiana]PIO07986.1 hypothetical protein AB205_0005590 [Aquarana catesbeiana]
MTGRASRWRLRGRLSWTLWRRRKNQIAKKLIMGFTTNCNYYTVMESEQNKTFMYG